MDADRFDGLTRSFGKRTSRRSAVKNLGGGGLLAAALAGLGLASVKVSAQDDNETCVLDLVASVRLGPDQNRPLDGENRGQLQGQLRFSVGDQGRLVDGVLQLGEDTELDVIGQVAGPAITMRIALPENRTLVLIGAGEQALRSCEGEVDGLLTGPGPGDLGDWHATATREGVTPTTGTATLPAAAAATQTATAGANPPANQTPPLGATNVPTQPPGQPPTRTPTRIPPVPTSLVPTEPPPPPTDVPTEPPPPTDVPTEVICLPPGATCTLGLIPCCSGNCELDVIIPDVGICA
jgi:hypothetical protein